MSKQLVNCSSAFIVHVLQARRKVIIGLQNSDPKASFAQNQLVASLHERCIQSNFFFPLSPLVIHSFRLTAMAVTRTVAAGV